MLRSKCGGWGLLVGMLVLVVQELSSPKPGVAQETVTVGDEIRCGECRIRLEPVVTLQPPADRITIVNIPTPSLAKDRHGRYLLGTTVGEAAIGVFDRDGRFIRAAGPFGDGPGEFSNSRMFIRVGQDDEVQVYQRVRRTTLTPGASGLAGTQTIRVLARDPVLMGDTVVARAAVSAPRGGMTPIQLLDSDGSVLAGIGAREGERLSSSKPSDQARRVARARSGGVWIAPWTRYELSRFDLHGVELQRVRREASWFAPYDDLSGDDGYRSRQRPLVEGMIEFEDGVVLVVISKGDRNFEPMQGPRGVEGQPLDPYSDDGDRLDTYVEAIDVREGALLAAQEFGQRLRLVSTPDEEPLLYSLRQVDSGELVADVWRVSIGKQRVDETRGEAPPGSAESAELEPAGPYE